MPELPVMKPKSSTAVAPNPCGTFPRSASEKVNDELRLGACIPVKPFSPEGLALPSGGKSKPMAVMVEVEPGNVIWDVFVMVNVSVLVCALNSQTTVAVEACPLSTPTMVMVSACAVAETNAKTLTALKVMKSLRNRDIVSSLYLPIKAAVLPHDKHTPRTLAKVMRLLCNSV